MCYLLKDNDKEKPLLKKATAIIEDRMAIDVTLIITKKK
jgi:hypothetical protein